MRAALLALAALWFGPAPPILAQHWAIADPGQGPVPLASGTTGARQLSGITWAGDGRYYVVSDKTGSAYPLAIELTPQGTIAAAQLAAGVPLPGSTDLEGVAFDARDQALWVSDETGPSIRVYRAADGALLRTVTTPRIFSQARRNLSFESVALDAERRTVWTANEEALSVDGPKASETHGTLLRVQRFDGDGEPSGQWAYRTDPTLGNLLLPGRDIEASGVSDLVALPDGTLLALERAYGAEGLRIQLFELDFSGATDVAALPHLEGAAYTPLRKTRLWQRTSPDANFEGAALGPPLPDGSRSLILISDDGHGTRQLLYALTLRRP